jgi:hypothetical protein
MARRTRVVLNRAALDTITLGLADGLGEVALRMLHATHPPDETPFGEGLVDHGATAVWVNGKKIGGDADKPRALRLDKPGVTAIVGFGFPGRFQEVGTVHQPARPFLTPGVFLVEPEADVVLSAASRKRLAAAK